MKSERGRPVEIASRNSTEPAGVRPSPPLGTKYKLPNRSCDRRRPRRIGPGGNARATVNPRPHRGVASRAPIRAGGRPWAHMHRPAGDGAKLPGILVLGEFDGVGTPWSPRPADPRPELYRAGPPSFGAGLPRVVHSRRRRSSGLRRRAAFPATCRHSYGNAKRVGPCGIVFPAPRF